MNDSFWLVAFQNYRTTQCYLPLSIGEGLGPGPPISADNEVPEVVQCLHVIYMFSVHFKPSLNPYTGEYKCHTTVVCCTV